MAVNTPCAKYEYMKDEGSWELILGLLGGTPGMREGRETFLPKEPAESKADYDIRLGRSFLTDGFTDAVNKATSRPFSKPITVSFESDEVGDVMWPILNDMDGQGTYFQQYFMRYFAEMITWGVAHSHTDFPVVEQPEGRPRTLKDAGRPRA